MSRTRSLVPHLHLVRSALALSAAALAISCLYDPDDRCGPQQELGALGTCVCEEPLVLDGQGCVPCGEHEVWDAGVCACEEGYTRPSEVGAACVLGGPGTPCAEEEPEACQDPAYAVCRVPAAGAAYCTAPCSTDADCPRGFTCDTESDPASCMSFPVGQGDPCDTPEDCAGKDASYCESTVSHACLVSGCSVDRPLSCSEGWICCDLQELGLTLTLCTPEGACPTR